MAVGTPKLDISMPLFNTSLAETLPKPASKVLASCIVMGVGMGLLESLCPPGWASLGV